MKVSHLTTATLCSAALALGFAPGIADAADPPAQKAQTPHALAINEVAYLGVDTTSPDEAMRKKLGLQPGTALIVRHVDAGTPADEAGLLPGDLIVRLNDQLLINRQQLAVLVRTFAPGDAVTLEVMRDGKAIELQPTLAGRVIESNGMIQRMPIPKLRPMPRLGDLDALIDQLHGPGANLNEMFDQMQRRIFEQRGEMQRMMDQMRNRIGAQGMHSSISISDDEHSLQLKTNGQERHLTVKTRAGDVLFDGPVPEDGQIQGLPGDVQKKVDDLLRNNRIELRMPQPRPQNREPLPIA